MLVLRLLKLAVLHNLDECGEFALRPALEAGGDEAGCCEDDMPAYFDACRPIPL